MSNDTITITEKLEELRAAIRAENISWGELYELQCLAEYIDPGDVELLEWAGVPEFPEDTDQASWENDEVQFARLIAEMEAYGVFENMHNWHGLFEDTDLNPDLIGEIIERAQASFGKTCAELTGLGGSGTMPS